MGSAAAGGLLAGMGGIIRPSAAAAKSKVAVVRNEKAISDRNICHPGETRKLVDSALEIVTGHANPKDAWTALGVTKDDIVGIKVNCNSWTFLLSTHPELVYALCDSLKTVMPENNIVIYERYTNELARAGYRTNKSSSGIRCVGTEETGGFGCGGITKLLTDQCTKLINIPSLKTVKGDFSGSLFLKNHIGSIPPNQMSNCHGNAIFCTEVCAQPDIKNKTVLAVCDGLRGTYGRGVPWYWKGIIMSRDQVAAEYVSLQVINEKRIAEKKKALPVKDYVSAAGSRFGLGTADPANIETVKREL